MGLLAHGARGLLTAPPSSLISVSPAPPTARRLRVPQEFLQGGVEYKLEVQAIERSGNQTLTEVTFRVR